MKNIKRLDEKDIKNIIATYFKVSPEKVKISTETRSVGYGIQERDTQVVVCEVVEEVDTPIGFSLLSNVNSKGD